MTEQCWWNPRQKGKGKGSTVSEIATESWPEEDEQNLIFAVVQSEDDDEDKDDQYTKIMMLTDNCADEHVCGIDDFAWIPLEASQDPGLTLANGSKLRHYGSRSVPLMIAGGRSILVEFQVTGAKKPILSVGKFCSKSENRTAWYDGSGGGLHHEGAGLVKVKKVKNHYALECGVTKSARRWTTAQFVAPVVLPGPSVVPTCRGAGPAAPAAPAAAEPAAEPAHGPDRK